MPRCANCKKRFENLRDGVFGDDCAWRCLECHCAHFGRGGAKTEALGCILCGAACAAGKDLCQACQEAGHV